MLYNERGLNPALVHRKSINQIPKVKNVLIVLPYFRFCTNMKLTTSFKVPCGSTGWHLLMFPMDTSRVQIPPSPTIELSEKMKLHDSATGGLTILIPKKNLKTTAGYFCKEVSRKWVGLRNSLYQYHLMGL